MQCTLSWYSFWQYHIELHEEEVIEPLLHVCAGDGPEVRHLPAVHLQVDVLEGVRPLEAGRVQPVVAEQALGVEEA